MSRDRLLSMARAVRGEPLRRWPGWSTGELVAVALVLNDHQALKALAFTVCEAFDRVSGDFTVAELRAVERVLNQ